jgi:predicted ribosomally synthesized peptide with nif11-like leader
MSKESLEALIKKMNEDEEFLKRFNQAGSLHEKSAIAKTAGLELQPADLQASAEVLSEEDLEAIAGGQGSYNFEESYICECADCGWRRTVRLTQSDGGLLKAGELLMAHRNATGHGNVGIRREIEHFIP